MSKNLHGRLLNPLALSPSRAAADPGVDFLGTVITFAGHSPTNPIRIERRT
ncbi:MAG: hypothetical protein ABI836_00590 [Gemmatimonadota bacterium]